MNWKFYLLDLPAALLVILVQLAWALFEVVLGGWCLWQLITFLASF